MPRGDTLWMRLEIARDSELWRLAAVVNVVDALLKSRAVLIEEISSHLRAAGGHSIRNWFRGSHDFPYKQILIDVADKLAPGWTFLSWTPYRLNDAATELDIEEAIWKFFEDYVARKIGTLSDEAKADLRAKTAKELEQLGYNQTLITHIGASIVGGAGAALVTPALAYSLALSTASGLGWVKLWWAGSAPVSWLLGTGTGVFALLYLPAFAWWLGSTAYRKTVPAVLYLIQARKLRELEATLDANSLGEE